MPSINRPIVNAMPHAAVCECKTCRAKNAVGARDELAAFINMMNARIVHNESSTIDDTDKEGESGIK